MDELSRGILNQAGITTVLLTFFVAAWRFITPKIDRIFDKFVGTKETKGAIDAFLDSQERIAKATERGVGELKQVVERMDNLEQSMGNLKDSVHNLAKDFQEFKSTPFKINEQLIQPTSQSKPKQNLASEDSQ